MPRTGESHRARADEGILSQLTFVSSGYVPLERTDDFQASSSLGKSVGWQKFFCGYGVLGGIDGLYKVNGSLCLSSVLFEFQQSLEQIALQSDKCGVLRIDGGV